MDAKTREALASELAYLRLDVERVSDLLQQPGDLQVNPGWADAISTKSARIVYLIGKLNGSENRSEK